jgi:tetratricopeptide (TPR) repeat protein
VRKQKTTPQRVPLQKAPGPEAGPSGTDPHKTTPPSRTRLLDERSPGGTPGSLLGGFAADIDIDLISGSLGETLEALSRSLKSASLVTELRNVHDWGQAPPLADPSADDPPPAAGGPLQRRQGRGERARDYYDLAGALRQELAGEDFILDQEAHILTLDETIAAFKKGVEENFSAQDYDTHFNLGIAYLQMGLLDEAAYAFELASQVEETEAQCCAILAGLFFDRGFPGVAFQWYTRGLKAAAVESEERLGLLYEMGQAYLKLGDHEAAGSAFSEIDRIDSRYRAKRQA